MRVLLSKESKLKLLNLLKLKYMSSSLKELSSKMKIPFKTLQQWIYEEKRYVPLKIISPEILNKIKILDSQKDNWGQSKGGKIGGKKSAENLKKKLGKEGYSKVMRARGKKTINTINNLWKRYGREELIKMAVKGKLNKRKRLSQKLEEQNLFFFKNKQILLDSKNVQFSNNDVKKMIRLPDEITKELAEETGIHLGDGCMSYNKNYFSVKTNNTEERYVTEFLFPLYKKLYNLDLNLMRLESVSGFEICSKALCEFKNKVLELPYGEKIHRIKVPNLIIETKNKEIYKALIRGLFDTDGCVCIVKKDYPVISISIKSKPLLIQVKSMLEKMGFISNLYKYQISINGNVMLRKWINEIGSSNPKKMEKLRWASRITG